MPVPSLSTITGKDIQEIVDSLEKQRKELSWLLQSLDNSNVKELNAEVINAGVINGKHIVIDASTQFAGGYDPSAIRTEMETRFSVISGEILAKASLSEFNALGQRVYNAEASLSIVAGQISSKVSETDFNGNTIASLINQTSTTVTILANKIELIGYVTVGSLDNPGAVRITESNIYGPSFTVGRGTNSTLKMSTTDENVHVLHSNNGNGFRISSNGSMSLTTNSGFATFVRGGPLALLSHFRMHSVPGNDQSTTWLDANQDTKTLTVDNLVVRNGSGMVAKFG